jgi:hypothetical protein
MRGDDGSDGDTDSDSNSNIQTNSSSNNNSKRTYCDIQLNRKVLSDLAANEPFAFKAIVDVVQESTGVRKEPAKYSHDDGWEFDNAEEEELFYYEPETMAWLPKQPKKKKKKLN